MNVRCHAIWLSTSLFLTTAPHAIAGWDYATGASPNGGVRVSASVQEAGFYLSLQCDSGDDPGVYQLTFVADEFPHLESIDDAETQLIFRFEGTGKDFAADGWSDVWYFAPDKAWTGSLYFEAGVLDSFGGASVLRILSMDSREVARFSMNGSRRVEQAIRSVCHRGLTPE
ncbi:MAG: hypothetical protein KIT02_01400 [Devosia sp.]|uniref:hypothetical protein n=1 Tax=Devosia sp. TaxID=1871048 RepID=UPI0024CD64F5|nr:hypothetical protein [Devosia sp.]UYN99923.1 MAG: hypothetical protein KIT02_01400 [Devosia sp.]